MATPSFQLSNAVAVVTGAASGIGRALSADLAGRGCALALVDRDAPGLSSTAALARHRGVTVSEHLLDMTDAAGIAALPDAVLTSHGRVNLLVNNAGVALAGHFMQITEADFTWLFNVNFWGPVRATRAFLPALLREKSAQIVNVSSIFGIVAPAGETAYASAKFALRGFSEALRHELERTSVGVSVVHPGGIATAIARNARISPGMDPVALARGMAWAEKMLVMPPAAAAARIAAGIAAREKRIIVGRDAVVMDILQRLLPTGYWGVIRRRASSAPAAPATMTLNSASAPE